MHLMRISFEGPTGLALPSPNYSRLTRRSSSSLNTLDSSHYKTPPPWERLRPNPSPRERRRRELAYELRLRPLMANATSSRGRSAPLRLENPFSLKVGHVFTGFGVGCGVGIGVGRPIYFGIVVHDLCLLGNLLEQFVCRNYRLFRVSILACSNHGLYSI